MDSSLLYKLLIFCLFLSILASLFFGLYFLLRDRSGRRTLAALSFRVLLSALLILALLVGYWQNLLG